MKPTKSCLAIVLGLMLNTSVQAADLSSILRSGYLLAQLFPNLVDLWLAGAPNNYYHQFPEEDYQKIKPGFEFNNFVVFGDSISDQGSNGRYSMYLAGGYDKLSYVDYLSRAYTGKISKPNSIDGLNYSQRGAPVEEALSKDNLVAQVRSYLQNTGGKAEPNSLYMLWGGAMDININLGRRIFDLILGRYPLDNHEFSFGKGPEITAALAQGLTDKGAAYIFVPNIPDSSVIPYSMMVVSEQLAENTFGRLKIPYTWMISSIGRRVDNYLRNPDNWILAEGDDFVRLNHIRAMQTQIFWYLPKPLIASLYDWVARLQKRITSQYNYSLERALKDVDGNVVYLDFAGFMNELVLNYKAYKIDNILVPTCTLGFSSRYCDTNSPQFHQGLFLFGDWFHPGPETHIAIGQYIQSVFDAPVYANSIARQLEVINRSRDFNRQNSVLSGELNDPYRSNISVSYSGENSQNGGYLPSKQQKVNLLNLTVAKLLNSHLQLGSTLSFSKGHYQPYQVFHYQFFYGSFDIFARYLWPNHTWAEINLNAAYLRSKDMVRVVSLLDSNLYMQAQNAAYSYGVSAMLRKNLLTDSDSGAQTGPLLQLELNRVHVRGYTEEGIDSVAMRYNSYQYYKNHLGIGWYYQHNKLKINDKPVCLFSQVKLNRKIGTKPLEIPASIKNASIMFQRKITDGNRLSVNVRGGVAIKLQKNFSLSGQLGYHTDMKNRGMNYSLAVSYKLN